jgi:peptidyl-prolyl cis-trans isomerase SurA
VKNHSNYIFQRLLLLLCTASASLPVLAEYQPLDAILVVVEEDVITRSDVEKEMTSIQKNLVSQKQLALPPENELRKYALDSLILKSLQVQMALKSGITVSDEQLGAAIESIMKRNGFENLTDFRVQLEKEGLALDEIRSRIRQDLLLQRLQQGQLRSRIQVTDQEISNYLDSADGRKLNTARYRVSHLLLALDPDVSREQESAAKEWLAALRSEIVGSKTGFDEIKGTKDGYELATTRLGWGGLDDLPTLFSGVVRTMQPGEISDPVRSGAGWHLIRLEEQEGGSLVVHQTLARHILVKPTEIRTSEQTEKLIRSLHERLLAGEDFSLLAKEYSEDKGSALQGGNLDWSSPGQFVPVFEEMLGKLGKNETSAPFLSPFGWHIVQKLDERDHDMTAEEQKNKAYEAIYARKFNEELESWLQKIRGEAFIEFKEGKEKPESP